MDNKIEFELDKINLLIKKTNVKIDNLEKEFNLINQGIKLSRNYRIENEKNWKLEDAKANHLEFMILEASAHSIKNQIDELKHENYKYLHFSKMYLVSKNT